MKTFRFTVVIPSYNRKKMIKKAIKSVLKQSHPYWKLLIIDDASTDGTVSKIKPFLKDKRIQCIRMKRNVGISEVMNKALHTVDTPYFIQLDSDDWLERNALQEFSTAIDQADSQTALYYGNLHMLRKKRGKWKIVQKIRHRSFTNKYDFLMYLTYMLHPRCYRTEAVRSVGGWDTDGPFNGRIMEDRRMCLKLIEKFPFYWINKTLYNRRKHKHQLTNKEWLQKRNVMRRYVIEHYIQKWGDHYQPLYGYRSGLLVIKKLVKVWKGE